MKLASARAFMLAVSNSMSMVAPRNSDIVAGELTLPAKQKTPGTFSAPGVSSQTGLCNETGPPSSLNPAPQRGSCAATAWIPIDKMALAKGNTLTTGRFRVPDRPRLSLSSGVHR
ncbi:hypothetical protein [Novosphingobium sp.]|uniref:hypothetical protein n=1 Tax=Novosphingobium sp. TaxID=1874826 RepID=UPI003B52B472